MQEELRKLIERHCATIAEKTEHLSDLLLRRGVADALEQAILLAHDIKGSGGSIGFDEVSEAATGLEDTLQALASGQMNTTYNASEAIRRLGALKDAARRLTPESSRLFNADLSAFEC